MQTYVYYVKEEFKALYDEYHSIDDSSRREDVKNEIARILYGIVGLLWNKVLKYRVFVQTIEDDMREIAWLEMWKVVSRGLCDFDRNVRAFLIECGKRAVLQSWRRYQDPDTLNYPDTEPSVSGSGHLAVNPLRYLCIKEAFDEGFFELMEDAKRFRFWWPNRDVYRQIIQYYHKFWDRPKIFQLDYPSYRRRDMDEVADLSPGQRREVVYNAAMYRFNKLFDELSKELGIVRSSKHFRH